MKISSIKLLNFRNYKKLNFSLSPDINFIIGENGSGKTNILEAISIASNIKSFRNISDSEIVKWDEDSYFLSIGLNDSKYNKFDIGYLNSSKKKSLR